MDHTSKQVIVPIELLEKLKGSAQNIDTHKSSPKNVSSLDGQLSSIVRRTDLSDYDKALMYQEALKKFLSFRKHSREPIKLNIVEKHQSIVRPPGEPDREEELDETEGSEREIYDTTQILKAIPKSYRNKAAQILDIIKHNQDDIISWNSSNELIYNKDIVRGSNVTDLLYDTLRSQGKSLDPVGWREFFRGLARMNVPEYLVGNPKRRMLIQDYKTKLGKGQGFEEEIQLLPTPPSHNKPRRKTSSRKIDPKKRITWERM